MRGERSDARAPGDRRPVPEGVALPPLRILRRTEVDAVVYKPAGQSCEAPGARGTLIEQARAELKWPQGQLPHRLDRPTCGLVVVARDPAVVAVHNRHIREGKWTKHYVARVKPEWSGGAGEGAAALLGVHRAYLKRQGRQARLVRCGGDPAQLEVLAAHPAPGGLGGEGVLDLLIRLDTGRYHQIRVMLAGLGAPLLGDVEYGGLPGNFHLEHVHLRMPDAQTGDVIEIGALPSWYAAAPSPRSPRDRTGDRNA